MRGDQRGFTLVELLVALALSSMLLTGVVTAIVQVLRHTDSNTTSITAVNQIETAAREIARDIQMAQTTDLTDGAPPVSTVTLTWTDWTSWSGTAKPNEFQSYSSSYYLSGTDLLRDFDDGTTITTSTIASYIESIQFSLNGGVVRVNIVSAPNAALPSEQRTYSIDLRPVGEDPRR